MHKCFPDCSCRTAWQRAQEAAARQMAAKLAKENSTHNNALACRFLWWLKEREEAAQNGSLPP
jgi:hypothetical protein